VPDRLEGEPYLVPGQTIDVAIVKYHAQEAYPTDPTTLVNGETIGSTKTTYTPIPGRAEDPPRGTTRYTLESSYRPVVWYIASVSDSNMNEFFRHGMFVLECLSWIVQNSEINYKSV
jgi:hypothetical protein